MKILNILETVPLYTTITNAILSLSHINVIYNLIVAIFDISMVTVAVSNFISYNIKESPA